MLFVGRLFVLIESSNFFSVRFLSMLRVDLGRRNFAVAVGDSLREDFRDRELDLARCCCFLELGCDVLLDDWVRRLLLGRRFFDEDGDDDGVVVAVTDDELLSSFLFFSSLCCLLFCNRRRLPFDVRLFDDDGDVDDVLDFALLLFLVGILSCSSFNGSVFGKSRCKADNDDGRDRVSEVASANSSGLNERLRLLIGFLSCSSFGELVSSHAGRTLCFGIAGADFGVLRDFDDDRNLRRDFEADDADASECLSRFGAEAGGSLWALGCGIGDNGISFGDVGDCCSGSTLCCGFADTRFDRRFWGDADRAKCRIPSY
mmetsp:Transcript_2222/g.5782  ORF Transcript_2222/g.5782 Transcript_2222/m.5782 type:complete len:316 (-) Transcript_2222:2496-3443(-)